MLGKKTGGRRRGVPNKKTALRKQEAAAPITHPCGVMLANMRFAYSRAPDLQAIADQVADEPALAAENQVALFGEVVRFRQIAQDCASRTTTPITR
jgi:hypothetical protein